MQRRGLQGLQGLQGLSGLNKAQYDTFVSKNKDLIAQHGYDPTYINNLYSNKQFIDRYGIEKFKAIPDINMRNTLYREDVINTGFNKRFNNVKGFDFNKYNQLSSDGKLKLMESNYLTPTEFEDSWQKHMKESAIEKSGTGNSPTKTLAMPAGLGLFRSINSMINAISEGRGISEAIGLFTPGGEEAAKKVELDKNQRILDNIYSEDADAAAKSLSSDVQQAYNEYATMSDNAVYKAFMQAITPGSYKDKNGIPNLGIADYKKYFGNGSENERKAPMLDFSIDDMRQVLAKKKVYDANMSPQMAAQALNNDAKRYATGHQNAFRKFGLFLKDVGISSLSYTADKVNGIYNLGLMAEDKLGDKPIVYVDDKGNVLDPNKTRFTKDRRGNLTYQGEDGNIHYVHRQQIDRTTLHNMGRNFDGSEDNSILNPQYWTRAEQFGTLDDDEQKQYEKLGASPYKVAYNPNEDSDLLYESFKMMSFGIADAASQLLPYGVGLFGKTLSTASKAGKIARGLGKALDTSGKLLTAESKVGQVAQGTAGALGIAYAYNRGAFQETLAQNLANAEEALVNTAKSDIYNRYQSDKQYKANVDRLVNARAASMKSEYLAQMRRDGGMRIADMKAVDKMIHAKAQDAVLGELVQNNINERKSSKEYADLQQKAIDGAGDAAFNTFLTEGLKYGFVNNLGYRKFLYTNPAGLSKKVSSSFKGLKEITTSEGKKRMATEGSKFLTRGQKLKEFGKTLGSQVWGGAWTNGTDDMQVDAAERINEDSFNKYLQAYQNGDALASTYGFADSLYSYVKGLQNSMGQETTWNSATVGGLGSVLSFTPNMTNIASLTTKEGREAYKNNFWREQKRDKDNYNKPILNEDGTPTFENKGRLNNWRGQINYLLQNGVLNTYYGKRQSERDLQNHADFVNNLLDEYRDFEDIEHLVASNMAAENYTNLGDLKTANYLKALHAINTLNNLGNDSKDPTTMSSVVQNAKALIDKAARFNDGNNDGSLNEEQISNVLSQYYASNPGLEQNEENNLKALEVIAKNAKELQKASKAFEDAGKEISKIESNIGTPIDPNIKLQLMLQKALVGHWQERKEKMQSEIEDSSPDDVSMDADTYIASVGGRKNAQTLVKAYNRQQRELEEELANVKKKTTNLQEEFDKATKEYKEAYTHGEWFTTDNATLELENKVKDARAKLDNSKMQEDYIEGMMARTANKRKSLEMDMSNMSIDETTRRVALAQEELARYQDKLKALREERKKYVNKNGERDKRYSPEKLADIDKSIADYEQNVASRKETLERNKEKVLTADEIFALDPITRARMMNEENRNLYTDEQKREIEKLEQKLRMKDADAIQKIQDIALLTQRINTNEDAYNRIASNPLAAAKAFEEQRLGASIEAAGIFNQRNAETLANNIKMVELASMLDGNTEEGFMEKYAYNLLRQHNHKLLDIMDEDNLLPDYQTELNKAKEWVKVTEDIDSVIYNSDKSEEWKKNIDNNISGILNNIDDKNSIIPTLEKIVDDTNGSEASQDIDYVLEGLRNLGYQRDSTILEERKQRKEREEADRKKKEEEAKKAEDDAKKAAEKKVEEESKKKDDDNSIADKVHEEDKKDSTLEDIEFDMGDEDTSNTKEKVKSEEKKEEPTKPQTIEANKEVTDDSIKAIAKSLGKTEAEVRRAIAELRTKHNKSKYDVWGIPSSALGNTADTIVRNFFAGKIKEHYPNITDTVLKHFIEQLETFKESLDKAGIHIVSEGVIAYGVVQTVDDNGNIHNLPVAGTLDLFGYDAKGNYYIFDMKTTRNHSEMKLRNEQLKWSRQVSLYADLLKQTYGINVNTNNLRIIPINVHYDAPRGEGVGMSNTGPIYSVDKRTGQLKMEDVNGNVSDYTQNDPKNFELRSSRLDWQFSPGYTQSNISWNNLTSIDQDIASESTIDKVKEVKFPDNVVDTVKKVTNGAKNFTLSSDENYYYTTSKDGKKIKYARVTSVIGAEKNVTQWKPTNQDVIDQLNGATNGKIMMQDNYGNGSIGFGDMYYGKVGSAKKGNFMATRDGDKISFSIDGNKETLYIAPEDYEVVTDEQEKHKKELFIANSLEKIDGDWYFNGTFADDNKQTQVKASDKFDIDKAIEEQQSARKVAIADEVSTAPNVIDNGDSVQVVSETIEQQASDVASDDKEVAVSDVNEDMDDANAIGENAIENNITTLSGNAMSRYNMEPLVGDGRIVLKKGKDERRQMDDFYAWMKAEGINLQNIIDHELARIIRRNPHAKVRFLMTNPNLKVTNDDKVHTHLFLALDYDNSINKGITSIHNDENGGVLESDGKKYLVIGVAGYGGLQNKAQQSLYNRLFNTYKSSGPTGMLIHPRRDFFAGHPNDRFYVAKDYTTEIVPHSQIPGYIVRQSLKDNNVQYRSVKELLSDKERNPMGYEFNDLAWGIQELSQFLIIGASLDKVMVPRNIIGNLGSAFVLMPASNGKMVPSYLKVLKYTEMKDGVLKDRVNDLLNKVVAPDYNTRYAAALELSNIFYMEKEGDFILLRKNKGEISLTHNGEVQKTFVLDSNFDRIEFMKAFEDINPRVNITARVLTSKKLLSEYDEAGALQTDAAMFGTAGSSYSIYALDNEGKMIIPAKAESQAPKADDGEWRNTNRRQIIFKKQYYTYNPEESDAFYLNSKAVTDAREIQQLQYIRRVLDGDFLPATSKGVWDYYVLDSTDSSEVIKIDRNSKEVRELPEKEAKELIKKLEEEKARKAKEEKAKEIMNKATDEGKGIEDVSLEGESTYVNPETGEVVQRETEAPQADNEENTSSDKASEESTNKPPIASEGQVATKQSSDTQSLADLMGNSKYRVRLRKIIANKWKDAPKHPEELEKYLRGKNIDVDNIGTSKEDIESWIKTIEDCR